MTMAVITEGELAPILTIFVGMLAGFYALFKFVYKENNKSAERAATINAENSKADRKERQALISSFDRVAIATETGSREAKERNGHLGEQNIELAKLVSRQNIDIASIKNSSIINARANSEVAKILSRSAVIAAEDRNILTNANQVVHEQTVEHQIINNKE